MGLHKPHALASVQASGDAMVIAVGWEIVPTLWPLLVTTMVVASAAMLMVARRLAKK